ncbi:MAG: hypothetical protein GKR90_27355 [Pseudomonadales bacterium]|nr:hypothetical protein [Pseudomonadales bacterium]
MAVYEINNGNLLRVSRMVGGKSRQTYFSLVNLNRKESAHARREAKALDDKWAESAT